MKLGIALSGGGVKGAAHIGVIQALEENNIKIDILGGTSSGSIVTALYAMGYSPDQMLKLFQYFSKMILRNSPSYLEPNGKRKLSLQVGGFFSGENIESALKEAGNFKQRRNMKDMLLTIVIPSVDILKGEKYVFTNIDKEDAQYIKSANIETAVRASCSYPGVFAPCPYQDKKFVDGGVADNIPTDEVRLAGADKVISVKFAFNKESKPRGVYGVAMKSIDMIFDNRATKEVENSDYILNIDVGDVMVFNIKKIQQCYEAGYKQTMEQIEKIKESLKK
ncbi:MAG: patatin-like phospholipase family protein [Clostridia bacterium]